MFTGVAGDDARKGPGSLTGENENGKFRPGTRPPTYTLGADMSLNVPHSKSVTVLTTQGPTSAAGRTGGNEASGTPMQVRNREGWTGVL